MNTISTCCLKVLIATGNGGKIREIQQAFRSLPITLRYLEEFPAALPVAETGETYRENAIVKALNYSNQTGLCAVADDSGLEVDALEGMPGIHSARFAGDHASDLERIEKLLSVLSQCPDEKRTARFVCCMALVDWDRAEAPAGADARVLSITEGKCEGLITHALRGANGFGFDPIFTPTGYEVTFGEMSSDIKRMISHRAQALASMREFLDNWLTRILDRGLDAP